MSNVPDELTAPPPRDPAAGSDVYSNSTFGLMSAAIVMVVALPAIVYKNLTDGEGLDPLEPSMLAGYAISGIAAIVALVMLVRWLRVRSLYRLGVLSEATIETLQVSPAGGPNVRATMDLRYRDARGQVQARRVAIVGVLTEHQVKQGGVLPVLVHPTDPRHIAVYTMMTGLVIP
jgi:hypothetical protein